MRKTKHINLPVNFFEHPKMREIKKSACGNDVILLYFHLLCDAYRNGSDGIFDIANIPLTVEVLQSIFDYEELSTKLVLLEEHGLIEWHERSIHVIKFWQDKHDRNSFRYKEWRARVFERDDFKCVDCGTNIDIQAHHIESWKDHKSLRYEVSNGVTLCRSCHLIAHGGSWRG